MIDDAPGRRRVHVVQGGCFVTDEPRILLTTILGSCVAACMRDPVARVGGMNHFLLPDAGGRAIGADAERYGVHLMEVLVNGLLKLGAQRDRLQAKLFGGARMVEGLSDVGARNADFAERFLSCEAISYEGGSIGGDLARRIHFWPISGRTRQKLLKGDETEPAAARAAPRVHIGTGDVELF